MSADAAKSTIDLAAATLARLLDRYSGDLVTGLHLVGSAAYDDFQPGRSDLDFVAVLSRPATEADLDALSIIHRSYGADPTLPLLGGIWITAGELADGPDAIAHGPTSHDGGFVGSDRGNRNPVTWFELRHAIAVIGSLDKGTLWHNPDHLVAWVRENADTYWRRWTARSSGWSSPGLAMLGRSAPMWGVLGISRQCYTVATGDVVSKSSAGRWALEHFEPRWHRIIDEALATRHGERSLYANPFARRRDALAFMQMAIQEVTGVSNNHRG